MRWWGEQRRWNIRCASCREKQEGTESRCCAVLRVGCSLRYLLARGLAQPLPRSTTMRQRARWAEGAQSLVDEFKPRGGIPALVLSDSAPPATIDSSPCPGCSLGISCSNKLLCKAPKNLERTFGHLAFSSLWIVFCDWQFNFEPKWAISGSCWDMVLQAKWLWLASE